MQYKCENNVIEQIDEISLTSNLGWIGYATISSLIDIAMWNGTGSDFKTDNDLYKKLMIEVERYNSIVFMLLFV